MKSKMGHERVKYRNSIITYAQEEVNNYVKTHESTKAKKTSKKVLTKGDEGGIIYKLSRETR